MKKPQPPKWLDSLARIHFDKIVEHLGDEVSSKDVEALAILVNEYSTYRKAAQIVHDEGLTITTKQTTKAHPALDVRNRSFNNLLKMLDRFGLTPDLRKRSNIDSDDDGDELDQLLGVA